MEIEINENILEILGLFSDDYLKEIHGRGISRMLNANQRTILLNVDKLVRIGIMKYKLSGKNKFYSLNLLNNLTKQYLIISEDYKRLKYIYKPREIKFLMEDLIEESNVEGSLLIYEEDDQIKFLVIGEADNYKIKTIFGRYNGELSLKETSQKKFASDLKAGDKDVLNILRTHVVLKNSDIFVDNLWKYFNEIRPSIFVK